MLKFSTNLFSMRKSSVIVVISMLLSMHVAGLAQTERVWFTIKDGVSNDKLKNTIEDNVSTFINLSNAAYNRQSDRPDLPASLFAPGARNRVVALWKTWTMYCPTRFISEICLQKSSGGYQIRNIPVHITNAPEGKQNQTIAIDFTASGLIDGVNISIEETNYKEILSEYISLDDFGRRQKIIEFVENFRTAYNIKDAEFIESVFSDQALIITGKVVKRLKDRDMSINKLLGDNQIVYTVLDKPEYIKNLKTTFSKNRYIDVKFEDIDVIRHPKHEKIYGVTLKQVWGSSSYNDIGYLFLMIDFVDENRPMIYVRSWQPPQAKTKGELFNVNSFNMQKIIEP